MEIDGPQIERARSNRSTCKNCRVKIPKGELRIGLSSERDGYVYVKWYHVRCAGAIDPNSLLGYEYLTQDEKNMVCRFVVKTKKTSHKNVSGRSSNNDVIDLTFDSEEEENNAKTTKTSVATTTVTNKDCYCNDTPCWCKITNRKIQEGEPNSEGLARIEFATAKSPSACMKCSEKIRHGDPRVGYVQSSSYYEGLHTRWLCLDCTSRGSIGSLERFSQLSGWDTMDYRTSILIRNMTNEVLDSKTETSLREDMNRTQHVRKIILAYFKNNDEGLRDLLRANDIHAADLGISRNRFTMALFAADAMLRGVASTCRVCERRGLLRCHGRVTCMGYLENSSVRCPFRASQVKSRRKFELPEIYSDLLKDVWIDRIKKKKRRRARDLGSIGELPGLDLKVSVAKSPSRRRVPPPKRERPEKGSPILQVHRNYEQTGLHRWASVVVDEDGVTVYNAILNQVDLSKNQNRYYVLQLLKIQSPHEKSFRYELFRTEGRIGRDYEDEFRPTLSNYKCYDFGQDLEKGISEFKSWFKKKTGGGMFQNRHALVQRPGAYAFVELSTKNIEKTKKRLKNVASSVSSDLQDSVYKFVSIISDDSTLEFTMKEAGLNIQELPLGELTPDVIKDGRNILTSIEKILNSSSNDLREDEDGVISLIESDEDKESDDDVSSLFETQDDVRETLKRSKLAAKSTLFYTKIPSKIVKAIDTKKIVREKFAMLDILEDVLTASTLVDHQKDDNLKDIILSRYRALGCELEPLDKSNPIFDQIETALLNTSRRHVSSPALSSPAFFRSICNVFEVVLPNQKERGQLRGSKKRRCGRTSNRRLLFHGAPMGVVASILCSGLRIMPGSGGRLGRGIYLADMASKSGYYARPTMSGLACLFLCEAECGRPFVVTSDSRKASSRARPPKNFNSVQAHGIVVPNPKDDIKISFGSNEVTFSTGEPTLRKLQDHDHYTFGHNEYVLYEEKKVRLRYVILLDTKVPILGL